MINERCYQAGAAPSAIRALFAYGMARKAEIGADKVFDFSIGNPSIPTPAIIGETVRDVITEAEASPEASLALHGYSQAAGTMEVRRAVAKNLADRFGLPARPESVYMTAGAAGALSISINAITEPGDDVIVIAPYFPEYKVWIETARCNCVEVPAREPDFQLDIDAIAAAIGPRTSAVILNSPNNPTGAVYTRESLEALAGVLAEAEQRLCRKIYIISDEPYRELVYGVEVPCTAMIWPRTIMCYSWSKSLSMPGERIGYVYVGDLADDAPETFTAVAGAGRALGFVCAPVLWQKVIERCIDTPVEVEAYAKNRELLTEGLGALGYEYVEPDGAFYLWVRALEPDAQAFSDRAKDFELLLVASDSFGVEGWIRIGYCVDEKTIRNSMDAFRKLKESYA